MQPNHHIDADTVNVTFDYESLPEDDREPARHAAGIVRERLANSTKDILAAGSQLVDMKARLRHGAFKAWLRTEVNLEPRSAQRIMRVAQRFSGKSDIVSFLPVTALYELAAPSVSDDVVDSVVERVREGRPPSVNDIKAMKKSRPPETKELRRPCADAAPSRSAAADSGTTRMGRDDDSAVKGAAGCAADGATDEGGTAARAADHTGSATSSGRDTLTTRAKGDPDPLQKEAEESPRTPEELELARIVTHICALPPKSREAILNKLIEHARNILISLHQKTKRKAQDKCSRGLRDGGAQAR